jgi:hypothetical protein
MEFTLAKSFATKQYAPDQVYNDLANTEAASVIA